MAAAVVATPKKYSSRSLYPAIIFITGFCSMVYELALAQLLSSLLGNTALRYASTLAIYILSMGIGSFVFRSKGPHKDMRLLFKTETLIAILGLLSPFLLVLANSGFISVLSFESAQVPILIFVHLLIALCGFLGGYEIPILASLYKESLGEKRDSQVLAWDYLGMFSASLCFPLLFFPKLGIFSTFWVTTLLNVLCIFMIHLLDQKKFLSKAAIWISIFLLLVNLCLLWQAQSLGGFLSEIYSQSL